MPTNILIPDEARQAQPIVEDVLGESIVGIYLFGSAVVGSLKRNSDVDILMAVNNSPTQKQREALVAQLMMVSRAPLEKINQYKTRMGWTIPWYSSYESDFNEDVSATTDEGERHGASVFLRDGNDIFRTFKELPWKI
ncbi:DUF899 family protein [Vreelandella sp. V005]|uniref:DUF899 family protein n=1 Tax=Vreelandella sp. V005 TaxID=3459608 RepID=UPI0040443A85